MNRSNPSISEKTALVTDFCEISSTTFWYDLGSTYMYYHGMTTGFWGRP
ncbi:MAG: hypothetical protein ACFFFG_03610 [Candidatus Thorarchaeota archaeon]